MLRTVERTCSVLAVVVGMLGASCAEETVPPIEPLGPRDQFAKDLGGAVCEGLNGCCSELGLDETTDACGTSMRNEVMSAILRAEEQKRELMLDQPLVDECIEAFEAALEGAASCTQLPHPRSLDVLCPALFGPIPEGSKEPGEGCEFTYECSSPAAGERLCYRRDFNETPHCTWFLPTKAGAACADEPGIIHLCPETLGCGPSAADETLLVCGIPPNFGEACTVSTGCGSGLKCVADVDGGFSCVDTLLIGYECLAQPDACAKDSFCDLEVGVCSPLPVSMACDGEPCPAVDLPTVCR